MLCLKFPEVQIFKPCAKLAAFIQVCTIILKRSWILVIILKCSWIHLRSLKSTGFLCQVLKSPQNSIPCLHHTVFCETEDITWPRGDTKFLFDWVKYLSIEWNISFNGKIKQIFRAQLPVSNIWNNHLPWIIAPPPSFSPFSLSFITSLSSWSGIWSSTTDQRRFKLWKLIKEPNLENLKCPFSVYLIR